jgi:hypothetical protein
MPEVQEVFRLATQKARPDPGFVERQHDQRRKRERRRKIGAFAVAAAMAVVVIVLVVRSEYEGHHARLPASSPSETGLGEPARIITRELTVEGIAFSVGVPRSGWSRGPIERLPDGSMRQGNLLISKSIEGPQGAEAVIFWTTYPDDPAADPCSSLVKPNGPGVAELAANVATAPGTELVSGPTGLTLGGFPAEHVVLTVRDAVPGCDPGFLYTWRAECWGPCWMETNVGDTISVWIVDVGGKRLFIEAETTTQADARLEAEVRRIVASIRFDVGGGP